MTEQPQMRSSSRAGANMTAIVPIIFGIFFSIVLSHAFIVSEDGIYTHSRSDGKLFNLARLQAKTKIRKVLIRELIFLADDICTDI